MAVLTAPSTANEHQLPANGSPESLPAADASFAGSNQQVVLQDDCPTTPIEYDGIEVLAPMVRASTLPLRLECLRYGAGLVYGEEIVDKKFVNVVRVENPQFRTVDFVSQREKGIVFSTCKEERDRVIFQMGTADPVLASQAALLVCKDVRGVDVNMGCPKSFSVKGGMGAALLDTPDMASEILKSLRRSLPSSCSVTCKIRMRATTEKTREFMQLCERSGAEAIAVHMRQREERPADPAHWDEIMRVWDAVNVPVIANGDFFTRQQINQFWKHCKGDGDNCGVNGFCAGNGVNLSTSTATRKGPAAVMIARGALWNPSIFCRDREAPPFEEVVRSYTRAAVQANSSYQNTKWVLSQMLAGGTGVIVPTSFCDEPMKAFNRRLSTAKSMSAICEMIREPFDAAAFPEKAHTTSFYQSLELVKAGTPGDPTNENTLAERRPNETNLEDGPTASKRARLTQ